MQTKVTKGNTLPKAPNKAAKKRLGGAKPVVQPAKAAVQRRDGSGHVDPAHAARLLALSRDGQENDDDRGFVRNHHSQEAIAEEFGEGAVSNMTSGEDQLPDAMDESADEESGGPFVETSAAEEFADGTDESNIAGATREPFPKTSGG